MASRAGADDLKVYTSPGEDLNPDITSYVVVGRQRTAIVDPGPDWHVERHLPEIARDVDPDGWLFAVILSTLPGCLSGLRVLSRLTKRRAVFVHWAAAANAGASLDGWKIRSPGNRAGLVPIDPTHRVLLANPAGCNITGALMGYDAGTQTLFSGPFFGSIGHGRTTGRPILRRESVRAYTELFTPGAGPGIVEATFGFDVPVARIAPAYGKLAVGGRKLIDALFEFDRREPTVPWAYHRLYLRTAGLLGEAAASALFQAAGVPRPDLEAGYGAMPVPDHTGAQWLLLYDRVQQWVSGMALSAIGREVARLSLRLRLPIPDALTALARTLRDTGAPAPVVGAGLARFVGADTDTAAARVAGPGHERAAPPRPRSGDAPSAEDALTDEVTGLLGETVFDERLTALLTGAGTSVSSLLLIGVDNIERINRRYGRTGGDDALHTVAYLLRNYQFSQTNRERHRVYKLSGPLFGYVLEGTPLADAAEVAERLRQSVAESAMFLEQFTVSVGVAATDEAAETAESNDAPVDPRSPARTSPAQLVQSARSRLHVARSSGMNTVCAADPEGVSSLRTGANVLIADPDASYLEILTRQLAERGYTVLEAGDGENALDVISQIVPDVIVCEAMLPKINGFAVRERLRHSSRLSEIPFVLISHRKNDELTEKASLLGIVHFLRKPLSLVELVGLLRNLTRGMDS